MGAKVYRAENNENKEEDTLAPQPLDIYNWVDKVIFANSIALGDCIFIPEEGIPHLEFVTCNIYSLDIPCIHSSETTKETKRYLLRAVYAEGYNNLCSNYHIVNKNIIEDKDINRNQWFQILKVQCLSVNHVESFSNNMAPLNLETHSPDTCITPKPRLHSYEFMLKQKKNSEFQCYNESLSTSNKKITYSNNGINSPIQLTSPLQASSRVYEKAPLLMASSNDLSLPCLVEASSPSYCQPNLGMLYSALSDDAESPTPQPQLPPQFHHLSQDSSSPLSAPERMFSFVVHNTKKTKNLKFIPLNQLASESAAAVSSPAHTTPYAVQCISEDDPRTQTPRTPNRRYQSAGGYRVPKQPQRRGRGRPKKSAELSSSYTNLNQDLNITSDIKIQTNIPLGDTSFLLLSDATTQDSSPSIKLKAAMQHNSNTDKNQSEDTTVTLRQSVATTRQSRRLTRSGLGY